MVWGFVVGVFFPSFILNASRVSCLGQNDLSVDQEAVIFANVKNEPGIPKIFK